MAEREMERKAPVYRSVSLKKLESWKAKRRSFGEDLERRGALPPDTAERSALPSQATRAVTVSRKVSKISASNLPGSDLKRSSHATSLSVRELSEKFVSNAGSQSNNGNVKSSTLVVKSSEDSFLDDSCSSKEILEFGIEKVKDSNQYSSTQESVSGSDSDRGVRNTGAGTKAGKRVFVIG